ncbi:Abi family protein [Bacillus velezensis]|uniref:Abi family protein n=1 Tax=Bacillus siamensis TaxID=659243 RepID=A0AAI8HPT3_9BACI|nr:Abi family protein [Bacillus siamensis]AUJ78121.1 Abi family protein [Bacillus siamensis]
MSSVHTPKVFKTHEEQLEILKQRGLKVDDDTEALNTLKKINYYRLTGYMLTMKVNDEFHSDASFNDAVRLHNFDEKLRRILLRAIESIEISFKAQLAYSFADTYGPLGYLYSENFNHDEKSENFHRGFIEKLSKTIMNSSDLFVVHHRNHYNSQLPIWGAVELLTMGNISKFYKNMHSKDKKAISKSLYNGLSHAVLSNWLEAITILRNTCAHYSRVYNKKFAFSIRLSQKIKLNNSKLVSFIYILKILLPEHEWSRFLNSFLVLTEEYDDVIEMHHMGFYDNWKEYIN